MYGLEKMQGYSAFSWPTGIIGYVCLAIGLYFSAKKANTKNPWVASIPVVQIVVLLQLIDKSGWSIYCCSKLKRQSNFRLISASQAAMLICEA